MSRKQNHPHKTFVDTYSPHSAVPTKSLLSALCLNLSKHWENARSTRAKLSISIPDVSLHFYVSLCTWQKRVPFGNDGFSCGISVTVKTATLSPPQWLRYTLLRWCPPRIGTYVQKLKLSRNAFGVCLPKYQIHMQRLQFFCLVCICDNCPDHIESVNGDGFRFLFLGLCRNWICGAAAGDRFCWQSSRRRSDCVRAWNVAFLLKWIKKTMRE